MTIDSSTTNNINLNIYNLTYNLKGHLNSQQSTVERKPYVCKICIFGS